MNTSNPGLLVTPGEPAGIGPDILALIAVGDIDANLVAIADPDLLRERIELLGLEVRVELYEGQTRHVPGVLRVLPVNLKTACRPGVLDPGNAAYVLETLDSGITACLEKRFDALVTGPVSKSNINNAGIPFTGHTEYLAEKCNIPLPVMMLANDKLRVALVTTHLALENVVDHITAERLEQTIRILHQDLETRFSINNPEIAVCGLNPHAGEDGHLGQQEITKIKPVIDRLRKEGRHLSDPLPADTVFTPEVRRGFDVILAMYHDQGLSALKALGFGETVNITLGLPIIRTSVDHGTALELAGTGRANPSSLRAAVQQAIWMVRHGSLQHQEPQTSPAVQPLPR